MFPKKLAFLVLISCVALTGCSKNYSSEKAFWKAKRELGQITALDLENEGYKVLDPSIAAFQEIADRYPGTQKAIESLFMIANLRMRQKQYDPAIEALQAVVRNSRDKKQAVPSARFAIATTLEAKGDWQKAEAAYWEAADYHAMHQKAGYAPIYILSYYKRLGDEAKQETAYKRALEHYEKVLKRLGPIQASNGVTNFIALTHLTHDKWQEAVKVWLTIPEEYPESPYAPMSILAVAELLVQKGQAVSGLKYYDEYFEKYPSHSLAQQTKVKVGNLYQVRKEYEKSRKWYEEVLQDIKVDQSDRIAEVKFLIGRSYQEEGNWEKAKGYYDEVVRDYPRSNAALQVPVMLSVHYQETGDDGKVEKVLDEAIAKYQKVIDASPNSQSAAYAQMLQNAAFGEKGQWERVIQNYDRNMSSTLSSEKKGEWLFMQAWVAESRLKDVPKAVSLYKSFMTSYPDHPLIEIVKSRLKVLQATAA